MELLDINGGQTSALNSLVGNWPILAAILGTVVLFVIARRSIRRAKANDKAASDGSRWAARGLASDEDLLAKYPTPGTELPKPETRKANIDDFFSNSARQHELKG